MIFFILRVKIIKRITKKNIPWKFLFVYYYIQTQYKDYKYKHK